MNSRTRRKETVISDWPGQHTLRFPRAGKAVHFAVEPWRDLGSGINVGTEFGKTIEMGARCESHGWEPKGCRFAPVSDHHPMQAPFHFNPNIHWTRSALFKFRFGSPLPGGIQRVPDRAGRVRTVAMRNQFSSLVRSQR